MADKVFHLMVNGKSLVVSAPPEKPLLWALREDLGLTGTKYSCGEGYCGACTVHVDGKAMFSCLVQIEAVAGHEITTIEGLSTDKSHPLQKAWIDSQVSQCGYCQSGQIMWAAGLLAENKSPTRQEIVDWMNPILCRCGSYIRVVHAIVKAGNTSIKKQD